MRASYPGNANEVTEQGIDAAVRELIPAVKVTAPSACQDRKIDIGLPENYEAMEKTDREREFLIGLAAATLGFALHGCMDLNGALSMASRVCQDHQVLCGQPPWTLERPE